jgi:hypothetical protein
MVFPTSSFVSSFRRGALAGLALALLWSAGDARADDDDARTLLKGMSDFMAKQTTVSFSYESTIEAVTKEFQKLAFVSSGKATISRPDKIRVTRTGGFVDMELVFDGKTFSLLGKNLNAYTQMTAEGDLSLLADLLAGAGIDAPATDLFSTDSYNALMTDVTDAKHIASAYVAGVECEYLAFRTPNYDWQIWIEAGDRPVPRRYAITNKHKVQAPQYVVEITDWKVGSEVAASDFSFKPPEGAKKVDMSELDGIDELPTPDDMEDDQ